MDPRAANCTGFECRSAGLNNVLSLSHPHLMFDNMSLMLTSPLMVVKLSSAGTDILFNLHIAKEL